MTRTDKRLASFVAGYCETMLWANTTELGPERLTRAAHAYGESSGTFDEDDPSALVEIL